jgi:hypothetical protein
MDVKKNNRIGLDLIGLGWAWNNYVVTLYFKQAGYNNDFDYVEVTRTPI